jgi:SPP1 gp7 family putative phage head morphogenesis protein
MKKPQTGRGMRVPAAIRDEFAEAWVALVERMAADVNANVAALLISPAAESMPGSAMDEGNVGEGLYRRVMNEIRRELQPKKRKPVSQTTGSLAEQGRRLVGRLRTKWDRVFKEAAKKLIVRMVMRLTNHSARAMKSTAKATAGFSIPLSAFDSPALREVYKASVIESTSYFRSISGDYLNNVQDALMRSITTEAGTPALMEELAKNETKVKNWAFNTARDQTTKVYASVSRKQMQAAGVKKFEWVHSGGGSHPRKYHMDRAPEGLNRGIFSFDDPPVIDERTGEKGFPAQLPNCRCFARPVFDFTEDDEE